MPLLTAAQLAELRQIIQDGATALAVTTFGDEVTPEELQRLVDEGFIDPAVLDDLTLTAFEYGALLGKLPEAGQMTFPQFAAYMRKDPVPLSKPELEAVEIARQRAGQFCRGLGNRYSDELGRIVVNADAELAQQLREGIGGEVAEAVAERESQGMLVRRLRQMSGQMTRDWTRIANTETHAAHQEGLFETTVGRNGEGTLFAKVPEADACEDCIKHYVDRNTGKPIVRPASWWASHGSNNVGRKRADWQPVLGVMHPWCRCQLVEVPEGFEFDDEWSLVPSEVAVSATSDEPVEKSLRKARKLHGRRTFQGFEVSIENRAGSCRHWYDRSTQTEGRTKMLYPYGYIRRTMGVDGDHVDVFLGPDESSQTVYVIHQMKAPSFDTFDEDKVMLGFPNGLEARRAYRDHYDDPRFFGGMTPMSLDEFRRKVYATADRPEMIKAKGEGQLSLFRPAPSGPFIGPRGGKWADAKHTRHWEPPELAETARGHAALGAPVPALAMVFVNASGGAEKKRFRAAAAHLAQSNVGIQIVAHEIPRQAKALDVYAKATHHGLHIMVDSGEAGRFTAQVKAADAAARAVADPNSAELAEKTKAARAKADKLEEGFNFDAIYDRCEALAKVAAPGTLQVVAPDRIAEPDATAHLRQQYAPRIRKLQEMGVQIIAPIQARDPEGMAKDYIAISEAFGDDVILGFPSAKAPVPMEDILPFAVQLYSAGKYPKLHFLGATEPAKLAERSAQLVAAAYFTSRGLPRERVLELCATPREAARALRNVKTQDDVLTRESDHLLWAEMTGWAREQGMDPDSEDFDETEAWPEFYREHPEEYDLSIRGTQDKETIFRELAAKLSQSDGQAVGMVQRVGREHDIVTGRQHAHGEAIEAVPKVERFIPLLDRYLQAKEHQGERFTPTARSGFEALFGDYAKSLFADAAAFAKAEFSGSTGNYMPRVTGTVSGMGQHSDPARTPGENVLNRDPVTEWPPFLDRPIRRRRKLQRAAERYDLRGRHKSDGGWANPPRNEQVQAERGEVDKDIARAAASGHRYREELEERQKLRVAYRQTSKLESDLQDYHRGSKP